MLCYFPPCGSLPLSLCKTQQLKPTRFKTQNATTETQAKCNHPIWSPRLHHSPHWFKQAPTTDSKCKTQQLKPTQNATTNLIFMAPSLSLIQTHADSTHNINSTTHTDSTHLWNPATNSTSIPKLKPSQHLTTTTKTHHQSEPSNHWNKPPL